MQINADALLFVELTLYFADILLTRPLARYRYLKTKVMLPSTPIRPKKDYHCSVSVTIIS